LTELADKGCRDCQSFQRVCRLIVGSLMERRGRLWGLLPAYQEVCYHPLSVCAQKSRQKCSLCTFISICSGVCLAGFPSNQYESGEGMFNKDERTQVDAFPYDPSEIDDQEE
jgi:hypothetical protein